MNRVDRRQFLLSGLALAAAPRLSFSASARIDILPDEPIGTINRNVYGHFTEHLGGCIYDGVWVGPDSKIPNIGGIRKQLVDRLKRLNPPVIRWPGGCFADTYNWRDGVGPRERRPRRTNFWTNTPYLWDAPNSPRKYEPNEFGTNEFMHFCRLVGAEPYFAANLRSATARDFYEWIEYCNAPSGTTTLADLRAQGGDANPFPVRFWGVGNESWGCGGNFTGAEYAVEYRRFTEWIPRYGVELSFIASGPNAADYEWTESFFRKIVEKGKGALRNTFGFALHYYCNTTGRGDAVDFTTDDWYKLLAKATLMEELISNHWRIMGEVDTDHRVKLVVDEWGAWHKTDPNISSGYLFAYYPTMRDALVSGLTLDIFNRNADKVAMANDAQLINNINTLFLAAGDRFTVTPIYHVFDMYASHQGGTAVRTVVSAPPVAHPGVPGLSGLAGSCSLHENRAVLTIVNPDIQNAQNTEINIRGRRITNSHATVLSANDIHAHNTFAQPNAVEPKQDSQAGSGSPLNYSFAPASVTRLALELA
ncbi:MAG: alpha-L-arabinofuranosidase [Acidobacteriaceae bacterium]|nr:alpha-L-arabinofuranosidase [Acidobacteriaceae bacterium]